MLVFNQDSQVVLIPKVSKDVAHGAQTNRNAVRETLALAAII